MKSSSKILFVLLVLSRFLSASLIAEKHGLQKNISFKSYIFFLENNSIKISNTKIFNNKFKNDFVNAIIEYKRNKFENAYHLLLSHLKDKPEIFKFYEYLVKTTEILNKTSELEKKLTKKKQQPEFLFLSGLVDYYQSNYKPAEKKFAKVLKLKPTEIEASIYLSNTQRRLGNYKKAAKTLSNAINLIRKNNFQYAQLLNMRGSLFFLSDKYEQAGKIYKKALQIAKKSGNNIEVIKANLNLGMINDINGDIQKAGKLFKIAYDMAVKINQKELEATVLSEWAVSFTYSNQSVEARKKYEKSYSIFEKFHNRERMALTAMNIARLYLNIGNYRGALDYYYSALKMSGENVRSKMLAYQGLGDVYTNLANQTKALRFYEKAKEISKQIKDISSETEINLGMGILFYNLGQPERALKLLLENFAKINENELPYLKAELQQKVGIIFTKTKEYSKAEKYLKASIKLSEKFGDFYNSILSNTYLAYSNILNNNNENGRKILLEQLKICRENNLNQLVGVQLLMLSETKSGKAKYNYLKNAVKYSELADDKTTLVEIYFDIAKYYEKKNKLADAEKFYLKAISIIENQLPLLKNSSKMQITFFANYHQIYNSLVNVYIKENNVKKAFEILDKSRSRNTLYNLSGIKFSEAGDINLVNDYYDVNWKILNNLGNKDSLKKHLKKIKNELLKKYPTLLNSLALNNNADISYSGLFGNNEYFISYYFNSDAIYVFTASQDGIQMLKLKNNVKDITNIVSQISPYYNTRFIGKDIYFNKDLFSFNPDKAYELYRKLLQPALSNIPENSELIFSLPNQLAALPFEFLTVKKQNETGKSSLFIRKYLIENYSISYSPSFSIWKELKSRSSSKNDLALFEGDPDFNFKGKNYASTRSVSANLNLYSRNVKVLPLKYSAEEIKGIEGYFDNKKVLLNDKATETNFKKEAASASIIHLSTHSFLFNNYPVVIFSNDDKKNDGYLETGEVAKLHLNSDMVVLSSCKSGLGQTDKAEGILGMQKVFFDAGASSVVLSLWDVNDKYTATLMKYFYGFLSKGQSKSNALRNAKFEFIDNVDPNPYYWAAFTLTGNTNPIKFSKSSNYYFYLAGLLILLFAVSPFIKKRFFV